MCQSIKQCAIIFDFWTNMQVFINAPESAKATRAGLTRQLLNFAHDCNKLLQLYSVRLTRVCKVTGIFALCANRVT